MKARVYIIETKRVMVQHDPRQLYSSYPTPGTFEKYRYKSLITAACGAWKTFREEAIVQGDQHQVVMERLYPQLQGD